MIFVIKNKFKKFIFSNLLVLSLVLLSFASSMLVAAGIQPVTEAHERVLKKVNNKYAQSESVSMDVKRVLTLKLLGKTKKNSGSLKMSKGKINMSLGAPDKSEIIMDDKFIWVSSYPPKEFKKSPVQVLQAPLNSQQAQSKGLVQLISQGRFFVFFRVTGFQPAFAGNWRFFLQPKSTSIEFKRAQVVVNPTTHEIVELLYWDGVDNKTKYSFNKIDFNKKLRANIFKFKAPKNSQITVL